MLETLITGILESRFNVLISTSGSTITAFAPFSMALGINSLPSLVKPLIAKNKPPSLIFLESE